MMDWINLELLIRVEKSCNSCILLFRDVCRYVYRWLFLWSFETLILCTFRPSFYYFSWSFVSFLSSPSCSFPSDGKGVILNLNLINPWVVTRWITIVLHFLSFFWRHLSASSLNVSSFLLEHLAAIHGNTKAALLTTSSSSFKLFFPIWVKKKEKKRPKPIFFFTNKKWFV